MAKLNESERGLHYSKFLQKKLGKFLNWTAPEIVNLVGPFEPEVFEQYDARRKDIIAACEAKLAALSDDEFDELIFSDPLNPNQIAKDWEGFMQSDITKLSKTEPPWVAAGFGHPNFAADFTYWAQVSYLSNHEALLLSLGVEPKHFSENQIVKLEERVEKGTELWSALHYMLRRKEQINRHFPPHSTHNRIRPSGLFEWFAQVELDVHPDFTSKYLPVSIEDTSKEFQIESAPKKPHKRELDTICQLFTVMAIEYYGYRPEDARSPTPKEIVDAAAKNGIQISDDTVRKYLRHGATFIPPEWYQQEI